jgi:hypothetical protein
MATENKKYLDLVGLQHLIDKLNADKRLTAHTGHTAATAAAVKVGKDEFGHVVLGDALSYNDLKDKPTIGDGTLTLQANGTDKGTFKANQSANTIINITAADLGLGNALHFKGTTTTALTDGATTNPITIDTKSYTAVAGDVVLNNNKEFIWNGSAWEELGDESSHALKSITISGGEGLTGSGTLANNVVISHATTTAASEAPVKVGKDKFGHVIIGGALTTAQNGAHGHTVSATIPASKFLKTASANKTKLSLTKGSDTFVKSYPGVTSKLVTTSITGTDGTVTASKATAGTAKDVAKAGTAVVYGTADVGETKTVATRASSQTTVGNANVDTKATVVGNANVGEAVVYGTANVGTAVTYGTANVGNAVTYGTADVGTEVTGIAKRASTQTTVGNANKATTATTVGNANVGTEITITGVSGSVTASKATAGTAVNVATTGTAVTVATRAASQTTVGNANVGTAVTVATGLSGTAYSATYSAADECLTLSALTVNTQSITPAASSSTKIYGCGDTTSITPAKSNGSITPWTFSDVTVPKAATSATKFNPAVNSTTEIYGAVDSSTKIWSVQEGTASIKPAVASTKTLTPAVASTTTLTPAVAAPTTQTLTPAAASSTEIYGAVSSSTKIYGVGGTTSVTSATAAPETQKIVPAVANGTITPYTFADVVAAKKADSATTVATGTIATTGTGDSLLVGLGTATTATALTSASIKADTTTGDVTVATDVSTTQNDAVTISGTAAENGAHNHDVQ